MTVQNLIASLQQYPPDMEVCIFDWKHNLQTLGHEDGPITAGIYPDFEPFEVGFDPVKEDFTPWVALRFDSTAIEDFEKDIDFATVRKCRVCGCTEEDCSQCIAKTGHPCHWIEDNLCSACQIEFF